MLVWTLTREEGTYGYPKRALKGHSHFVEDVVISSDGQFALSGSWDGTLRLWDLNTGNTTRRFLGHTKDVLSVAFSADNRQVLRKFSEEVASRSTVANVAKLNNAAEVCIVRALLSCQGTYTVFAVTIFSESVLSTVMH